jgi:exosome complex RNA-binding protein Rrp4
MPALNTTQGHQRIDTCKVIPLHRGHITQHELVPHCEPQESGPTLIDDIKSIAALAIIVGITGVLWVKAGCPGLHYIGG